MKNTSNPTMIAVLAGVVVLGSIAGAISFMGDAGKNDREAKALLSQIREEATVDRELAAINERLQLCNKRLEHIVDERPEVAVSGLMTRLEQTGIANGLIVTGVRPKDDANKPAPNQGKEGDKPVRKDYDDQLIEVKGSGEYISARRFIEALENFPNIVRIESLDISPRQNGTRDNSRGSLDMTITLRAYLYPEVEQPKAGTEEPGGGKKPTTSVEPSTQARGEKTSRGEKNG
ncbi:MAG: type 4a pilus biogenesis protein PilO [Chthonomonas sp.]|nr:type 4a pilus biogenesis protein PilO [Chthonomonas sp.]